MNVRVIDLSYNSLLTQLPRKTFAHLEQLNQLSVSSCSLEVLHSEHVKTPFESGSLTYFNGDSNSWQCDRMCEFVTWSSGTESFSDIATMGNCTSPKAFKNHRVLSLQPATVCPSTSTSQVDGGVFIIFAVMISCVFAVAGCFLFAGRLAKSCSTTSTSPDPVTMTSTGRGGVENYSFADTPVSHVDSVAAGSATMDRASPPPRYDDPPSYDEVVKDHSDFHVK